MRTGHLASYSVAGLFACALILTILVVRREFGVPSDKVEPSTRLVRVEGWRQYARRGHVFGSAEARITIVEFSDFQCPFCRELAPRLKRLRVSYPEDVRVVYRHYPLQLIHPHAYRAAVAAECAEDQGRFEAFHDSLFVKQDSIGVLSWGRFGKRAGMGDTTAFVFCILRTDTLKRLRDGDVGKALASFAA